jgi:aspartyl-tRNA synthetase
MLKQLLMVAGVERYFQIARCFRDEDLRADRQPEFTQLDLEMSFVGEDDVLGLMEDLYTNLVRTVTPEKKVISPFARLTWREAMDRYGSDKPDLRFSLELKDLSDIARRSGLGIFTAALDQGGVVKGLVAPGCAGLSRRELEELTETARARGARGLAAIALEGESGASLDGLTMEDVRSALARHLTIELVKEIGGQLEAKRGDLILIVAAPAGVTNAALGALRNGLGQRLKLADPHTLAFALVTEFPLFEWNETQDRLDFGHNPFSAPHAEDLEKLEDAAATLLRGNDGRRVVVSRAQFDELQLGRLRSRAYDIVVNGLELASGSIRIHRPELQADVFRLLGYAPEQIREQFGHMLEAFEYGAPPHGGIAPGIDRTVMVLAGETSLREVIPFPKTQTAQDLMTGAPSPVDSAQLDLLHLAVVAEESKPTAS